MTQSLLIALVVIVMIARLGFMWSKGYRARNAFRVGYQALEAGDLEEAERILRKAVKLEPISAIARDLLGITLARRGNAVEAEEQFRMMAADVAKHLQPVAVMGVGHRVIGDQDVARIAFELSQDLGRVCRKQDFFGDAAQLQHRADPGKQERVVVRKQNG